MPSHWTLNSVTSESFYIYISVFVSCCCKIQFLSNCNIISWRCWRNFTLIDQGLLVSTWLPVEKANPPISLHCHLWQTVSFVPFYGFLSFYSSQLQKHVPRIPWTCPWTSPWSFFSGKRIKDPSFAILSGLYSKRAEPLLSKSHHFSHCACNGQEKKEPCLSANTAMASL